MLVLSRKKNQTIVIDGGIEIEVLQLKGGAVKLGISAPDHVRIVRGELDMFSDMIPVEEGSAEAASSRLPQDRVSNDQVSNNRVSNDRVLSDRATYDQVGGDPDSPQTFHSEATLANSQSPNGGPILPVSDLPFGGRFAAK